MNRIKSFRGSNSFLFISLFIVLLSSWLLLWNKFLFTTELCSSFLTVVGLIIISREKPDQLSKTSYHPVIMIGYLFGLIALFGVLFATNPRHALAEVGNIFMLIALMVVASAIFFKQKADYAKVLPYFVLLAAFNAILGITLLFLHEANSSFLSSNSQNEIASIFSFHSLLGLPIAIAGLMFLKRWWKALALVTVFINLYLIISYLVPLAYLALILGLVILIIFPLNYFFAFQLNFKRIIRLALVLSGSILIIGISLHVLNPSNFWQEAEEGTEWLWNYRFGTELEKVDLWDQSMKMYRDHPLTGVGLSNWEIAFPAYGLNSPKFDAGENLLLNPQNDWVKVLSETGLLGILSFAAVLIGLIFIPIRRIKYLATPKDRIIILSLFISIIVFTLYSMLDHPLGDQAALFLFGIIAALLLSFDTGYKSVSKTIQQVNPKFFIWILILILSTHTLFVAQQNLAGFHLKKALEHEKNEDWPAMFKSLNKGNYWIISLDKTANPYTWTKSRAQGKLGMNNEAFESLRMAYREHPNHLGVLNDLGLAYANKAEYNNAMQLFNQALDIAPEYEEVLLSKAALAFDYQDQTLAFECLQRIKPNSEHRDYPEIRNAIIYKELENLIYKIEHPLLRATLIRFSNNENWLADIYGKSISESRIFSYQLIEEAVFILESLDKQISATEAAQLRSHHLTIE